jgi:ABC-2 type transport system ATP-binding protein
VINRGKIVADGSVEELASQAEGALRLSVEALGDGVADAIAGLEGVLSIDETRQRDARTAVTFSADASKELRPAVFELAKEKGWTLYELHQEARDLEDLFRELTGGER